jgi:PRTRC genetic system ThiF family protein
MAKRCKHLPTIYNFDPGHRIAYIALVGAGGTGAQIARMLARLLYDMKSKELATPTLTIYDPDVVESRNIGRQLFTAADIEQNKAQVVATRLNLALGLDIRAAPTRFDPRDLLSSYSSPTTVVIGAVDNAEARQEIAANIERCIAWIDCGNHEYGGQVVIGNSSKPEPQTDYPYTQRKPTTYNKLPGPHLIFPELLQPDPEPLSCADLAAQNRQSLFVNDWMAITAMGYVQKLLMQEPITSFITYVDTITGNTRSVPITAANINAAVRQIHV